MSEEVAQGTAAAWLRGWTDGSGFAGCCAPDVQYEDPLTPEPLRGVDALEGHAARIRQAFPDLRLERTAPMLTREQFACIAWRAAGTHRNGTAQLPATNRFLTLHGVHYFELADGSIRRARGFYDLYDGAAQLGILPSRGGVGESLLLLLRGFGLRAT